jgi:hypothetical protein
MISQAKDKFPDIENYSNCWPVNDLIMMHLKYALSHARRLELEMAAGKSKKLKVGFQSLVPLHVAATICAEMRVCTIYPFWRCCYSLICSPCAITIVRSHPADDFPRTIR